VLRRALLRRKYGGETGRLGRPDLRRAGAVAGRQQIGTEVGGDARRSREI
jgi:hypothetical protein